MAHFAPPVGLPLHG
jgi:hypothetical protein